MTASNSRNENHIHAPSLVEGVGTFGIRNQVADRIFVPHSEYYELFRGDALRLDVVNPEEEVVRAALSYVMPRRGPAARTSAQ